MTRLIDEPPTKSSTNPPIAADSRGTRSYEQHRLVPKNSDAAQLATNLILAPFGLQQNIELVTQIDLVGLYASIGQYDLFDNMQELRPFAVRVFLLNSFDETFGTSECI